MPRRTSTGSHLSIGAGCGVHDAAGSDDCVRLGMKLTATLPVILPPSNSNISFGSVHITPCQRQGHAPAPAFSPSAGSGGRPQGWAPRRYCGAGSVRPRGGQTSLAKASISVAPPDRGLPGRRRSWRDGVSGYLDAYPYLPGTMFRSPLLAGGLGASLAATQAAGSSGARPESPCTAWNCRSALVRWLRPPSCWSVSLGLLGCARAGPA
jgi:hypothetical protein